MTEIPDGYHLEDVLLWGECLVRDDNREFFRLTDRPFLDEVDHYLGYLPSQLLEHFIFQPHISPITVLDAGGGRKAATAREIAAKYGSQVDVTTIDFMPPSETIPENVRYLQGDICAMDLPQESIDLVLSYQVLPHFGNTDKQLRAIAEMARVLKPGRVALIDDSYFSRMSFMHEETSRFGLQHNVWITSRLGNRSEKGTVMFGGPGHFTMMLKQPIDYKLCEIRERIFGHI